MVVVFIFLSYCNDVARLSVYICTYTYVEVSGIDAFRYFVWKALPIDYVNWSNLHSLNARSIDYVQKRWHLWLCAEEY